tara:strand:+ start:6993 stop:7652 length:660 start_codon:yes stop_codon:yes gene_type:complete
MKLANMGTVGTGRLTEMGFNSLKEMPYEEEEEELELGPEDEVPAIDDEPVVDAPVEEPELGMEPEAEMGGEEDLVMSLLQAIQGWADERGVDMGLEGGDDEGTMDLGVEDELPAEEPEMAPDDVQMAPEMEMDDEEELALEEQESVMELELDKKKIAAQKAAELAAQNAKKVHVGPNRDEAIVREVTRRVAKRLRSQDKKEVIVNQLAERIMKRLSAKK